MGYRGILASILFILSFAFSLSGAAQNNHVSNGGTGFDGEVTVTGSDRSMGTGSSIFYGRSNYNRLPRSMDCTLPAGVMGRSQATIHVFFTVNPGNSSVSVSIPLLGHEGYVNQIREWTQGILLGNFYSQMNLRVGDRWAGQKILSFSSVLAQSFTSAGYPINYFNLAQIVTSIPALTSFYHEHFDRIDDNGWARLRRLGVSRPDVRERNANRGQLATLQMRVPFQFYYQTHRVRNPRAEPADRVIDTELIGPARINCMVRWPYAADPALVQYLTGQFQMSSR